MFAIRIEPARLQQRDAILNFLLDHFRLEEPLCHALHLTRFDSQKFFGDIVDRGLIESVSFVALNDQNEIVACHINELIDFPVRSDHDPGCPSRRSQWPATVKKLADFLNLLTSDVGKLLPSETKKIMKFLAVSVHPDYQRRGLARRMTEASMDLATGQGCDYAAVGATAHRSQRLFETKLSFQTLKIFELKDYPDPDTGAQMFKCDDGTACATVMVKKLRD